MSDDDFGDFDNELLALAEGSERKRKKKQSKSSTRKKRQKQDDGGVSDAPESEDEEEEIPYPLEGKYIDEEDRERLLEMPEVKREEILASRQDERQRIEERREMARLVAERAGGDAKSAQRQQRQRGSNKEKTKKLDELKAKRKAKSAHRQGKSGSSPARRSESPMDMDTSSDKSTEEGEVGDDSDDDRREDSSPITKDDVNKCIVTRTDLKKNYRTPWFNDWARGAYVRFLIGSEGSDQIYRLCEISGVPPSSKPDGYSLDGMQVKHDLELTHGRAAKVFSMERVSNSQVTDREFDRYVRACKDEQVILPSKSDLQQKREEMTKLASKLLTESDISIMIQKNSAAKGLSSGAMLERSRLLTQKTLAERRHDFVEAAEIEAKLQSLGPTVVGSPEKTINKDALTDRMAKVNERNRKANLDAIRRAEVQDAERRRRERKLAASGTATPSMDANGRLKPISQIGTPTSRPGTPNVDVDGLSISPLPEAVGETSDKGDVLEKNVLETVSVDLGDF